jgi:hypothetical protein
MNTSGICPACQGRLSLWAGLKAPTPFHFRCPHCGAKLRIEMRNFWPFLFFVLLAFVGLVILWIGAWRKFGMAGLATGFICYPIACIVAELATGIVFYTYAKFTVKSPRKDAS